VVVVDCAEVLLVFRKSICILNPFFGSKLKDSLDLNCTLYIPLSDSFSIIFPVAVVFAVAVAVFGFILLIEVLW
jgi:hypothetical protein